MKKIIMTFLGSCVLIGSLAGPADAQSIRYGLAIREPDGAPTARTNGTRRLGETISFVNDCDNPPCTSFDIRPAINNSVAAIDRILYAPQMRLRSEEYHDSIEFGHSTLYPMEYNTATSSYFSSLSFHEDTNNLMTLWKGEDESPPITVFDTIQIFLFGVCCVIGLFGSHGPQKKRRRKSQKRKRKIR